MYVRPFAPLEETSLKVSNRKPQVYSPYYDCCTLTGVKVNPLFEARRASTLTLQHEVNPPLALKRQNLLLRARTYTLDSLHELMPF